MQNKTDATIPSVKLCAAIDSELFKKFKAKTAQNGVSMTDVIIKAIQDYLNSSN